MPTSNSSLKRRRQSLKLGGSRDRRQPVMAQICVELRLGSREIRVYEIPYIDKEARQPVGDMVDAGSAHGAEEIVDRPTPGRRADAVDLESVVDLGLADNLDELVISKAS